MQPTKCVRHDPAAALLCAAAASCTRLNHLVIHLDDCSTEYTPGENVLMQIFSLHLHPGCPGVGHCAESVRKSRWPYDLHASSVPSRHCVSPRYLIGIKFAMFSAVSKSSAPANACLPKTYSLRPNFLCAYPVVSCMIHGSCQCPAEVCWSHATMWMMYAYENARLSMGARSCCCIAFGRSCSRC